MSTNLKNETFIEMTELCQIIKAQDARTANKWCKENQIPIRMIGKKRLVSKFLVEIELDKDFIKMLKNKYPMKWEELYLCYQNNDKLNYTKLTVSPSLSNSFHNERKSKPVSKFAKKFASK